MERYIADRKRWTPEMRDEFRQKAPLVRYTLHPRTSTASSHRLSKTAGKTGATWITFWFLRIMFGPYACSRQSWFPDLVEKYPAAMDAERKAFVPINAEHIIQKNLDWALPGPDDIETPMAPTAEKRKKGQKSTTPHPSKQQSQVPTISYCRYGFHYDNPIY